MPPLPLPTTTTFTEEVMSLKEDGELHAGIWRKKGISENDVSTILMYKSNIVICEQRR